jgi:L-ascorbate metabolism protein UlaG (beta-lactamase superfamily)
MNGFNFITDPIFCERIAFGFKKILHPLKIKIEDLPNIDAILISHGHYDHLDVPSLKKFPKNIPIIVPYKRESLCKRLGFSDIRGLDLWETTSVSGVKITAVPAYHFPGRSFQFFIKDYQGYVIEGSKTVYFSGDTGLENNFKEIGEKFNIDLAILPIGAYRPAHFRNHHLSPEDALEAMKLLNAKKMMPVHWGTFKLSLEPITEPPERLMQSAKLEGLEEKIVLIKHGDRVNVQL